MKCSSTLFIPVDELQQQPSRPANAMKPFVSDQEVHITRGSIVSHISPLVLFLCLWLTNVSSRPNYKYLLQAESPNVPELRNSYDTWESAASVAPWEPPVAPADTDDNQRGEALPWNQQTNRERDYHYTSRMYYTLTLLNDTNALCNDGTQAGYYYRRSKRGNSQNWLIFLEGGWYCFDNITCQLRESSTFSLFSSSSWPQQRPSSDVSAAKYLTESQNIAHIQTCDAIRRDLGSRLPWILQAVTDSLPWGNTREIHRVVFAGSSAGGIGVLMNIDRLRRRIVTKIGHPILVSGIVDSAWFIHIPAYRPSACSNIFECPAEEGIHRGMRYWKAHIPKSCRQNQPKEEKWKCFLAPFMYRYIKTPVYIVQSLFDEAQMQMSKVPLLTGGTYGKWTYIQKLGKQVAQSLQNIKGVFAPSCIDHEILTKNNWVHKAIGNTGLVDALLAWDRHLLREWSREKLFHWSLRNAQSLFYLRAQYLSDHSRQVTNSGQPINFRFTRNSTLLFLSRLISMLNNRSKQNRHQPVFPHTSYPRKPIANDPVDISQNLRTSDTLLVNSNKKSLLQYEPSSALIVRPHGSREQRSLLWPRYRRALDGFSSPVSSHVPRNEYLLYHLIDSCGLAAGSNTHGPYVCSEKDQGSATKIQVQKHRADQLDNLIPQCNPTCGFLSNPQRMKLVDVLALYEINTEVLAKILGLTSSELRNLNSEEQMKLLFCGNSRLKRHLLSRRRRGTI
ncbi:Palmitoleoyl-protein carboxylesterase notum [Clonorchis sinensis]|uniref:Palmitoleoyl-protein carboxylesterase notum n=1 Tax=Clonorchis sinensis TaxID=79923 RepID=A0A3R7GU39_CLOSI|nr:Palmitoleoyl-protein carboxylesterase notum [Clonorchis sinensis]